MKKISFLILFLLLSCKYNEIPEDEISLNDTYKVKYIEFSTNTHLIIADGNSSADLFVSFYDKYHQPIESSNLAFEIYDNENKLNFFPADTLKFKTIIEGEHNIKIKSNGLESEIIQIIARKDTYYEVVSLPVIFHIIHFGEDIGTGTNLSTNQVKSLLDKLNRAFSNLNNSINPNAVDIKLNFRMARYNINNIILDEPGINRIDGREYDVGSSTNTDIIGDNKLGPNEAWKMGGETFWDPNYYLNIWIFPSQSGSSTASLPKVYADFPIEGLNLISTSVEANSQFYPSCFINTNSALNNTSIIHEVGHILGLLHVFSIDECETSDYCTDTFSYIYRAPEMECGDNLGLKLNDNYMDYIGEKNTFTYEQRERIRHMLNYGLWLDRLKFSQK